MDFDGFDLNPRGATGAAILDAVERDFWLDLWRAPVLDAVAVDGIETRWYGPLQATVVAALPEGPLLNLLLSAAEPGAATEGHLAQALEWIDSLGLDCRVPIDPERPEAGAAEELLNQWGYAPTESQMRFSRNAAMMIHWETATHLGFAATAKSARGKGFHTALLHRCILDAAEHSPTLFAETCEPLGRRDGPSAGCRNLLRAGFSQASVRHTWRPRRG